MCNVLVAKQEYFRELLLSNGNNVKLRSVYAVYTVYAIVQPNVFNFTDDSFLASERGKKSQPRN